MLTFARPAGAVLAVDVFADAVSAAVLRCRVVALPTPELEAVSAARRPRSPGRPLSVDGRADLVAGLLLDVRAFTSRSSVDRSGLVAGSNPFPDPTTAFGVAVGPLSPGAPLSRNWNEICFLIKIVQN